jgi:oligo-1,6-glucosidase
MTNAGFTSISDYRDMPTLNEYQNQKNTGGDIEKFIETIKNNSRDNGRTPFQWNDSTNAGFGAGTPWIKVNPNYSTLNAFTQEKDPNSVLNYFRQVVKLRKETSLLVYGKYTLLDKNNPDVYTYTRELDGKKLLVVLNFKSTIAAVATGIDNSKAKVLLSNYSSHLPDGKLQPYEAIIYEL